MANKKKFRISLDIEMEFDIAEKADDENFAEDDDFNEVCKNIITDCLECDSDKIEFFEIVEIK